MNDILILLLEKVCEALYFSLFLIIGKNLKERRLLFIIIMVLEYLALTSILQFNIWIQIIYTFMSFVNLKVLYRDKAQITDIFLFAAASIILILISFTCGMLQIAFGVKYQLLLIINRIILFMVLFLIRNKIHKIYAKYYNNWNRHSNNKIRSLTLRNISIITFNVMFCIINIGLIYAIFTGKWGEYYGMGKQLVLVLQSRRRRVRYERY